MVYVWEHECEDPEGRRVDVLIFDGKVSLLHRAATLERKCVNSIGIECSLVPFLMF